MERYRNLGGTSGVVAFEIAQDSITIQFKNGWFYLYTDQSTGTANITKMRQLATNGQGLNSFISRVVREGYARKWR